MSASLAVGMRQRFGYHQSMDVESTDTRVSRIAAAIAEPTRTRMLFCLMDGVARTSTELAVVAGISPGTASVHLNRLREDRLVKVHPQGKHRYYSLESGEVAVALEALSVVAGVEPVPFVPNTPPHLRAARTCYDHLAGTLAVALHNRFRERGWLSADYDLTGEGVKLVASLGVDVAAVRKSRRRFAFGCMDWSERRPHLGGALGAALLQVALRRKWLRQDLDSRAVRVTLRGSRELERVFGVVFK